jgi:nucleotide-binding universal stress UspA family protein
MSNSERELKIRRILVALDASPHSLAALEAAAELAADLEAELLGLFVEDINLLRLAELPFARESGFFSLTSRPLSSRYMQRQLRAQAQRARQALALLAERSDVSWSFRVARGAIAAELLSAAAEADLTILGKAGWSLTRRRRLGSTARQVLVQSERLTLILQHGACLEMPALVVYDGSPTAARALNVAVHLMRGKEGELIVLLLSAGPAAAQELRTEVLEWLHKEGLKARFHWMAEDDVQRLIALIQEEESGVLVLPGQLAWVQDEAFLTLLEQIECPVLLVR